VKIPRCWWADEELNAILEQSLGLMKFELTKHRVAVIRELEADLPLLKLDRNKIQQVFINLFLNAIQAMPEGGTLTIS
jgi:signal transduction histidine kinase